MCFNVLRTDEAIEFSEFSPARWTKTPTHQSLNFEVNNNDNGVYRDIVSNENGTFFIYAQVSGVLLFVLRTNATFTPFELVLLMS